MRFSHGRGVIFRGFALTHVKANMYPKMCRKTIDFEVRNRPKSPKIRVQFSCHFRSRFFIDFWRVWGPIWGSKTAPSWVRKMQKRCKKRSWYKTAIRVRLGIDFGSILGPFWGRFWDVFGVDFRKVLVTLLQIRII